MNTPRPCADSASAVSLEFSLVDVFHANPGAATTNTQQPTVTCKTGRVFHHGSTLLKPHLATRLLGSGVPYMVRLRPPGLGVKGGPQRRVPIATGPPPGYAASAGARSELAMDCPRGLPTFFQYGAGTSGAAAAPRVPAPGAAAAPQVPAPGAAAAPQVRGVIVRLKSVAVLRAATRRLR